jgi:hypothetical protein
MSGWIVDEDPRMPAQHGLECVLVAQPRIAESRMKPYVRGRIEPAPGPDHDALMHLDADFSTPTHGLI